MRSAGLLLLLLVAISAKAGTLEVCQKKSADTEKLRACVQAERVKSTNQLRQASIAARNAVNGKTREESDKSLLRTYRNLEARHVRERSTNCRQYAEGAERTACEADMNKTQIEQLTRFIEHLE